jgi:hypothetical protein
LGEAADVAPVDDAGMLPQPASAIAARAAAHSHTRPQAALPPAALLSAALPPTAVLPTAVPLATLLSAAVLPTAVLPTALRLVASGRSMSLGRLCPLCRFHWVLSRVLRFDR